MITVAEWFKNKVYNEQLEIYGVLLDFNFQLKLFDIDFYNNIDDQTIITSDFCLIVESEQLRNFLYSNIALRGGGFISVAINAGVFGMIIKDNILTNLQSVAFKETQDFGSSSLRDKNGINIKFDELKNYVGNGNVAPRHDDKLQGYYEFFNIKPYE